MEIQLSEDQFGDLMKNLDKNGDGKINFIEFNNYLRDVSI